MLEHRRKENDEKQKSKIVEKGRSKGKTENTNTQEMGKKISKWSYNRGHNN